MPKDVYIALWHLDTRADPGPREPSILHKLLALQRAITTSVSYFGQLGDPGGGSAIRIFAAPEYYFAMGGDYIRGYSADEKTAIVRSLMEISATYPGIILCPGTVAWKELMDRSQRRTVAADLKARIASAAGNATDSFARELTAARGNIKTGRSITKSDTVTRWFGHNTAYVLHGGVVIAEVSKAANAGEFNGEAAADRVVMIPGFETGKIDVPNVEGVTAGKKLVLGLEICADAGRLTGFREEVDIQLLISASQIGQSPAARPGGLYLHCDSNYPPRVRPIAEVAGPTSNYTDFSSANIVGANKVEGPDLYACKVQLQDRPAPPARPGARGH